MQSLLKRLPAIRLSKKTGILLAIVLIAFTGGIVLLLRSEAESPYKPLYRLHNPTTMQYRFTMSEEERSVLVRDKGYIEESIAGYLSDTSRSGTKPLYRLHNPAAMKYYFTMSEHERDVLVRDLDYWNDGIAGYLSDTSRSGTKPLYRLRNPATMHQHFTMDENERNALIRDSSYFDDGIAGYMWDRANTYETGTKCPAGQNGTPPDCKAAEPGS
jgi:hypothetical protein